MSTTKGTVTRASIQGIADGIRYANGSNTQYKPADMETAVRALKKTLVSKTATANGTYAPADDNADGYNEFVVDVPGQTINLQAKTATENGTVTPDTGYDGLSSVVVNVSGGGASGVYVGTSDPDASIGVNGDYYYKRNNSADAIQNKSSLSPSGSNTKVYGIEFYVTEDCSITKLRGLTTEARTGSLRIGTTSAIIAEKTCSFPASQWAEVTLDSPVSLTANEHYIVQVVVDDSFSSGKIGYVNAVFEINYDSKVKYVTSRYGSFPGTTELNSGILVDFFIVKPFYTVEKQYFKVNGAWVLIA